MCPLCLYLEYSVPILYLWYGVESEDNCFWSRRCKPGTQFKLLSTFENWPEPSSCCCWFIDQSWQVVCQSLAIVMRTLLLVIDFPPRQEDFFTVTCIRSFITTGLWNYLLLPGPKAHSSLPFSICRSSFQIDLKLANWPISKGRADAMLAPVVLTGNWWPDPPDSKKRRFCNLALQ